jgi:hypothetical protein
LKRRFLSPGVDMRIARVAFLLLLGLSLPILSEAQSLGNVARKERERRDKNKKEGVAAREFSEEEIFGEKAKEEEKAPEEEAVEETESASSDESPSEEAVIPGVSSTIEEDGDRYERESRERRRSEAEWRSKISSARARIAEAQERVRFFEELHLGPNEYYVDANGNKVIDSLDQLQRMTREAKEELAAAELSLKQMQEEARRSGIPPGWLR